jgi:RNA polymerase sigma-70 factor (ECF subfamily)
VRADALRQDCLADIAPHDTENALADLLRLCAARDERALRRIYDHQAPRLKGLALRITGSHALAEDVLHDVFLHIWQEAARFDPQRGAPRAWLTTLVRFRALEVLRRSARERPVDELPDVQDDQPNAYAQLLTTAEGQALHACLAALDPPRRQAITLAFVEGCTHGEVAAVLGLPLGTVKSTIRRGLAALKRCLEP